MWIRLLALLAGVVTCVVAGGCSGPPKPVTLQAYNGDTNEPLGSINVDRWDFEPWSVFNPVEVSVYRVPLGMTGSDGTIGSPVGIFEPSFMFYKEGWKPAEVRVEGNSAYVASPSSGNRRYRKIHGEPLPLTLYEREVPARPLIRVPMWPADD